MFRNTMTVLIAATLAWGLFAPYAQARGAGGHVGGRDGAQVGGEMHIPSDAHNRRIGGDFGRSRVSSGFGGEIDVEHLSGHRKFCHPDCGPYGCRYLWQYSCL